MALESRVRTTVSLKQMVASYEEPTADTDRIVDARAVSRPSREIPVASGPLASCTPKQAAYYEYLAGPVWAEKCKAARARAGQLCEECESTGPLEVHHLTYARFGGGELDSDLRVLCYVCHPPADQDRAWHDRIVGWQRKSGGSYRTAERKLREYLVWKARQ